MIKGVNKKVLEINNPQSLYFEKAVLYLKPNMSSVSCKLVRAEAEQMIRSMSPKKPKSLVLRRSVIAAAAFASGFCGALAAYWFIIK